MSYLTGLLIAAIALLAPANALAQTEPVTQSNKATPVTQAAPPGDGAQANPPAPDSLSFPKAVSYPKIGTRMKVRLNNKQEIAGNLTEVHRDYFVLTDNGTAQKILQADVLSMKANKSLGRRIKPLTLPFKVVGIAAALPPLGVWLLVREAIRELRGKSND